MGSCFIAHGLKPEAGSRPTEGHLCSSCPPHFLSSVSCLAECIPGGPLCSLGWHQAGAHVNQSSVSLEPPPL